MPPRLNIWPACRALTVRSRPLLNQSSCIAAQTQARRTFADNTTNTTSSSRQPQRDAQFNPALVPGSKAPAQAQPTSSSSTSSENEQAIGQLQMLAYGLNPFDAAVEGHKYGLPELPIPSEMHMKHRYDPVVVQITKLLMWDGKLSKAQRDMALILNYLRTSPPPKVDPSRPLVPGAPPAHHLPLDPVQYLTVAIDSVAPLVRVRGYKGLAGGGASLDMPIPLAARQRRRQAFQWILDAVNKKKSKGSGRSMFPHRVAEEIVAVVEGRSGVWDRRQMVHKIATSARANLNHSRLKKR
ncbi:ribosomal protein S7 domain-containing protein [Bombardia bombarda]|uniref:Small ribosomal subunit protein uS7m n=1 Tax=Bombardia bombarda TaxID=252184 RepID=A0AA39X837_9PEZI|nr:ribosomal protein S7 domain-containing protein [Bombardia bombarda]